MAPIEETLARLGLASPQVEVKLADASDPIGWWDGTPFDAILLDAPCSATGIVRRQPDIKWHRREDDIAELVGQQSRLLDACALQLDPKFGRAAGAGRQRLPGEDGMDGFFYALLEKRG
jgi:16S rRNA (cytosine967-C5)-methyltransferase